jgi:hypothetical protein
MTEFLPSANRRAVDGGYNRFPASMLAEVRRAIRDAPEIGSEHFDTAYDAAILMLATDGDLQIMSEPLILVAGVSHQRAASIAQDVLRSAEPSRSWRPRPR